MPATGTVDVDVEGEAFHGIGQRGVDVWDGEPEGVYAPSGAKVTMTCISERAEVFIAGARFDGVLEPLRRARRGHRQGAVWLGRHQDPSQDQAHPRHQVS